MAYYNNLSDEEIQDLKDLFSSFDKHGAGAITTKDLELAMKSRWPKLTEGEVRDYTNEADSKGKGTIDYADFENIMACISYFQSRSYYIGDQEIIDACTMFDKDGEGLISKEELKQVLMEIGEQVTEEEVEDLIKEAELDENGRVYYEEFIRMMMAK